MCSVPSGLVLITREKRRSVRFCLLLSVLFTGYSVGLSFYFFTRTTPELNKLPFQQRFYKNTADLELDAYINRLLYGFAFLISALLWLLIGVLCNQFLSVLPADPVRSFGKEESAPLLNDLERGELQRTKRSSTRGSEEKVSLAILRRYYCMYHSSHVSTEAQTLQETEQISNRS